MRWHESEGGGRSGRRLQKVVVCGMSQQQASGGCERWWHVAVVSNSRRKEAGGYERWWHVTGVRNSRSQGAARGGGMWPKSATAGVRRLQEVRYESAVGVRRLQ